jgi:methyltransferase (TIGR00027 family)
VKAAEASTTAKVIAASTILLASDTRTAKLVAPGAAALCRSLMSGSRVDRWLAASAAQPLTRALWRAVERLTLPGIIAHYWNRKRAIESRCRRAIADGVERIVILGAGFDTLALRLCREMPAIEAIEIDHPATQAAKVRALANAAEEVPENLRFISCDLAAEPLPTALFDDGKPCMIIIEGVLMYLPPADVARLFDTLRSLAPARTRVAFTFMTRWPDGGSGFRPKSWLIERWLAWRAEPFMWSLEPAAMRDFLAAHGFSLTEMVLTRELAEQPVGRRSLLEGENLIVCDVICPDSS